MPITKRITIERYKTPSEAGYAGLIEGETDAGRRWIMWLGQDGSPEVFWPDRNEDGSVKGQPKVLWSFEGPSTSDGDPRVRNETGEMIKASQVTNYADVIASLSPKDGEEVISTFPIWDDGMRAILFGIVPAAPPEQDPRENLPWVRMLHLLTRLQEEFITTTRPVEEGWNDTSPD